MTKAWINKAWADVYAVPDRSSSLETQLLFGEHFEIKDEQSGWAFGTSQTDDYQGYVSTDDLERTHASPTHQIAAPYTMVYEQATATAKAKHVLAMGSLLSVLGVEDGFAKIAQGFVPLRHLRALAEKSSDFVACAESLRGVPYLWGGRCSHIGIDCSALLQLALAQTGIKVPRNSKEQEEQLGKAVKHPLKRGDLVFWQAHIGIMLDPQELLHANAFHMCVSSEPLLEAEARIKKVVGDIRMIKRL